LKKTIVAL